MLLEMHSLSKLFPTLTSKDHRQSPLSYSHRPLPVALTSYAAIVFQLCPRQSQSREALRSPSISQFQFLIIPTSIPHKPSHVNPNLPSPF